VNENKQRKGIFVVFCLIKAVSGRAGRVESEMRVGKMGWNRIKYEKYEG
jgi:hypothetical protein